MITAILASLVIVLLGANAFVYIFPRKRTFEMVERPRNPSLSSIVEFGKNNKASEIAEIKRTLASIEHKLDKTQARIEYAFQKINKLESALTKNGFAVMPSDELYKKLERLEDFRREATIAIEAMKDYLKEKHKEKQKPLDKEDKEMEEKIRSLIFRGRVA